MLWAAMKKWMFALVLCAIPVATQAARLVPVVQPEQPLTKNLIVIVDASGSMSGKPIAAAMSAVGMLMRRQAEVYDFKLIAFRDRVHVWPMDWVQMPAEGMLRRAREWLQSLGGAYGTTGETLVTPAVRLALSEERSDLSIVLISDGAFTFGGNLVRISLETGQKLRKERRLGEAVFMTISIGVSHPHLEKLGRIGRGGAFLMLEKRKLGQLPGL